MLSCDRLVSTIKRWRALAVAVTIIVVVTYGVTFLLSRRSTRRALEREAQYQASLRSYSEALAIGMSRKEVEAYLRRNGRPFRQMCCMPGGATGRALDDLTQIGAEPHPWHCSEHNVYIGFAFVPNGPRLADPVPADTETLTQIRIFHWLEGCL
jgi:hypothetical protein